MMTATDKRWRILIVEDDEPTRSALEQFLQRAGYETLSAGTFEDGLHMLREANPDLLITDVRLGDFNGLQLLATRRAPIPSLVITGFHDPVLEADAHKLGADYIVKPVRPAQLGKLIQEKLKSSADRDAAAPVRRWVRKPIRTNVPARIEDLPAHIVDVSYGGLRFEVSRAQARALPQSFRISLPESDLNVSVHLVWTNRQNDTLICGAEVLEADDATAQAWQGLVDAVS